MKKILAILLAAACFSPLFASDSPPEFSHVIVYAPSVPLYENAYGIIHGAGYEFRVIKDSFLFSLKAGIHAGLGTAVHDPEPGIIYGIYKNDKHGFFRAFRARATGREDLF